MISRHLMLMIFAPFYLLLFLIGSMTPRKKNRIVFGSWFGRKFDDSTKYLFLEALKHGDIDPYFIIKDRKISQAENAKVLYAYSLKGIFIQLTAKHFFCAVNSFDFFAALRGFRATLTQVGHGLPIKRGFEERQGFISKMKNAVRRMTIDRYDFVISNHEFFSEITRQQWKVNLGKIIEAPMARCDALFSSKNYKRNLPIDKNIRTVIYAPTHRDEGATFSAIEENCRILSRISLQSNNLENFQIMVKLHFYDYHHVDKISHLPNIKIIETNIDTNEAIAAADILISDYSSIVFDYAHLNRPILCLALDVDEYSSSHRGLYFDLGDIFHYIAYDTDQAEGLILSALSDPKIICGLKVKFPEYKEEFSFSRQALTILRERIGF